MAAFSSASGVLSASALKSQLDAPHLPHTLQDSRAQIGESLCSCGNNHTPPQAYGSCVQGSILIYDPAVAEFAAVSLNKRHLRNFGHKIRMTTINDQQSLNRAQNC
jgi:hypothetical protein